MINKPRSLYIIGILLFSAGIFFGIVLLGYFSWAKLESIFYFGYTYRADQPYISLVCPRIMKPTEVQPIKLTLKNPGNYAVSPPFQIYISHGNSMRTIDDSASLAPGQIQKFKWDLTAKEATFERMILIKVYVNPTADLKRRTATCAVVVIDLLGLSGSQVLLLWLGLCLVCLAGWGWIWNQLQAYRLTHYIDQDNTMTTMAIILLCGIISNLLGIWLLGVVLLIIAVFMVGIALVNLTRLALHSGKVT